MCANFILLLVTGVIASFLTFPLPHQPYNCSYAIVLSDFFVVMEFFMFLTIWNFYFVISGNAERGAASFYVCI